MRIVDLGRTVVGVVAIFRDEPRADLNAAARDAFSQYTPPPGQVWVGAAASRHLRGRRYRPEPDDAERDHAYHAFEHHEAPILVADKPTAMRFAPTAGSVFTIHQPLYTQRSRNLISERSSPDAVAACAGSPVHDPSLRRLRQR